MDEYIRKQEAIDIVVFECGKWTGLAKEIRKQLKQLPAADVVPVVHSEWERHMSFGICRNCGYEYNWTGADAKNFCPNCGANMDGDRKE